MSQLLDEINRAVPGIGRDVRFFIADQDIEAALLQPGQPYSIYRKTFKRSDETRATVSDPIQPMRQEGPKINIQWVVLHTDRKPLSLASNDAVPAEVTLLQLWKMVIRRKVGQPTIQIMWGHHYRAGSIIETGKVTSLEEADMLEVIVDDGKAQLQTHVDVKYTVGTETFTASVRKGTTIGDFRESLAYTHRGKQIVGIAFEGVEIAKEDAVDEFLVSAFALAVLRVFVADGSDRARGEKWLPSQPSC